MLSNEMRTQQWVTEFKQYRNIKSLDRKTVVMLIDRIVVYSTDRIEIHFNYEDEITEFVKYAFANGDLLRKVESYEMRKLYPDGFLYGEW